MKNGHQILRENRKDHEALGAKRKGHTIIIAFTPNALAPNGYSRKGENDGD